MSRRLSFWNAQTSAPVRFAGIVRRAKIFGHKKCGPGSPFRAMPMRRTARCAARRVLVAKSGGPNTAPEEGVRLAPGIPADTSPAGILRRRRARLSPTRQGPCFRISRPQRPFLADTVSRERRLGSSVASGCGAAAATPRTGPGARTSRAPCLRPDALRADAARRSLPRTSLLNRLRLLAPALRRRQADGGKRARRRLLALYAPSRSELRGTDPRRSGSDRNRALRDYCRND